MERRSAKRATPRKHYTVDAFEGIEELKDAVSEDEPMPDGERDDSREPDFEAEHEAETEEDEMSDAEAVVEEPSEDGSDVGERNLDDISIADDPEPSQDPTVSKKPDFIYSSFGKRRRKFDATTTAAGDKLYTRALPDMIANNKAKDERKLHFFGPADLDYEPTHKARIKWAMEPCLPSRKEDKNGFGGFHHSFSQTEDVRRTEALKAHQWYDGPHGRARFDEKQSLRLMSEDEGRQYMPAPDREDCSFVMGPHNNQKLYKLSAGQSMPIADAFPPPPRVNGSAAEAPPASYKAGFMFNLGARVHSLSWLPGQSSIDQYLAMSVLSRTDDDPSPTSAFVSQKSGRQSIQIWRFTANEAGYIDRTATPHLTHVLCTDWGEVKASQWCHVTDRIPGQLGSRHLGLLVAIWGDGGIRILDVPKSSLAEKTQYLHIDHAAFEAKPPDTVFTCLTWISSTRLAAGCANGCVAIWDLAEVLELPSANARPRVYSSISTGYILSMTTCYPSRPNHLLTTSMDGFIRLTDLAELQRGVSLSSPAATASSQRSRSCHPQLLWHDYAQIALIVDDNCNIKGMPLRRIFNTIGFGRLKSAGTAFAASPVHPFVLAGTASGEVLGLNPTRRIMDGKAGIWQQIWFEHEWRRPTQTKADAATTSTTDPETASGMHDSPFGLAGLSRILEGFKPERISLAHGEDAGSHVRDGVIISTVYEEKSAVTALAWNPNIHVGGWAAVGMADGLLRVGDIAS